jgi:hypothetical protein
MLSCLAFCVVDQNRGVPEQSLKMVPVEDLALPQIRAFVTASEHVQAFVIGQQLKGIEFADKRPNTVNCAAIFFYENAVAIFVFSH